MYNNNELLSVKLHQKQSKHVRLEKCNKTILILPKRGVQQCSVDNEHSTNITYAIKCCKQAAKINNPVQYSSHTRYSMKKQSHEEPYDHMKM